MHPNTQVFSRFDSIFGDHSDPQLIQYFHCQLIARTYTEKGQPDFKLSKPIFMIRPHIFSNRYAAEVPLVLIQSVIYVGLIAMTRLARPNISKLCYRRADKNISFLHTTVKIIAMWSILAPYIVPFLLIPRTIHPLLGWTLYLLGSFSLSTIAMNAFLLPMLWVLVPWLGIFGALLVMAFPLYSDGIVRALAVFCYAFCCAPIAWVSLMKVLTSLHVTLEREAFLPRLGESLEPSGFNKLY